MVLSDRAKFDLAARVRTGAATLGEVFTFVSGLYFRGKMAYSQAFAYAPSPLSASLVITPGHGLVTPDTPVTLEDLRDIASVPIDSPNPRYREPLERDAKSLAEAAGECD